MNIFLLLLAILPGLILSFLIIKADRYEQESKWLMAAAFVLGALITYPTMLMEGLAATLGWEQSGNFFKEFFKFICLALPYFRKEFNEPLDGIVYAVLIAMGFATLENIMYADRFGIPTVALRAFTAVPAHAAFAVIMGYYVGLSKQDQNNLERWKKIGFGLGLPAFLHGLYDFFIIQQYAECLMSLATLVLVFSAYLAYRMIRILQNSSPFNPDNIVATKEPEDQNIGDTKEEIVAEEVAIEEPPVKIPSTEEIPEEYNDVLFSAFDNRAEEE
jgi:RsiW-degrading membrane proteinase PrsW (M82 family)